MGDTVVSEPPMTSFPLVAKEEAEGDQKGFDRSFIPLAGEYGDNPFDEEPSDHENDDEAEEEKRLLELAKEQEVENASKSKLCQMCLKVDFKYRCPKCDFRSCSLDCSKKHKEKQECDGVRGAWQPVAKVSHFNQQRVNEDEKFLNGVVQSVTQTVKQGEMAGENGSQPDAEPLDQPMEGEQQPSPDGLRRQANSPAERYLLSACYRRRIFLAFSEDNQNNASRHEHFSDTIFWTVSLEFRKELDDGQMSSYSYTIHQIPDSIHIRTVLRQFLKPRKIGPVVSASDLDLEKLEPFIQAGVEGVNVFMPKKVKDVQKYYGCSAEQTVLDSLRNRDIVNHPTWVVTLPNEFATSMDIVTPEDLEMMRQDRMAGRRGNGERGRGGFRGGGRDFGRSRGGGWQDRRGGGPPFGGGRGGGGQFRGGSKRPFDGMHEGHRGGGGGGGGGSYPMKRGRGFERGGRGGGRGGAYRQRRYDDPDEFDPFEPCRGRHGREMEEAIDSWSNVVKPKKEVANAGEQSNSGTGPETGPKSGGEKKNYFPSLDSLIGSSPEK